MSTTAPWFFLDTDFLDQGFVDDVVDLAAAVEVVDLAVARVRLLGDARELVVESCPGCSASHVLDGGDAAWPLGTARRKLPCGALARVAVAGRR